MSEMICKVHLTFVPDEVGYLSMKGDSSRRAAIVLEMMDELQLKVGSELRFPGSFADTSLTVMNGKFEEDSLDEKLRPLVLEYNGLWRTWQIEEQGRPSSDVGNIQMVSTALQQGVYYYSELGNPQGWCRRGFALELVEPSGAVVPFRLARLIDPAQPSGPALYADLVLTLTHTPHLPN